VQRDHVYDDIHDHPNNNVDHVYDDIHDHPNDDVDHVNHVDDLDHNVDDVNHFDDGALVLVVVNAWLRPALTSHRSPAGHFAPAGEAELAHAPPSQLGVLTTERGSAAVTCTFLQTARTLGLLRTPPRSRGVGWSWAARWMAQAFRRDSLP
jgi:hypothetical protein